MTKDSVQILKNNIVSYHIIIEFKKKPQRQKLKTSFKICREESKTRYIEENTGIIFNNFKNLNGMDTNSNNRCPDISPYSIPL